ncbi:probable RNA-dependent RNA polymerase 1 [Quercus lobata]|uniref:probable RNA-dependent RNA polymerase 1 n=1 Tax=Quercus lobata TaxID=97700 RepID=UPI001247AA18|nr:probable RNA-dependent RNA polymerase 1 [Quercus lobata]
MGCLDETRTLEYGQVFVQISRSVRQLSNDFSHMVRTSSSNPNNLILEGEVVVAKNPCLHLGDVRVLKVVDVPALHHLADVGLSDCVVFLQKGKRPHSNECFGSDLDGDLYFVCWDLDLIPPQQIQPMEYIGAKTKPLDHNVTIEEVQEYFVDYILNDRLGIIDDAHIVFADSEPRRAMSSKCIKLAKLHSKASAWDPIPTDNVPPDKASHVFLYGGGQGFNFYPFGEIVYADYKEIQLLYCYWEWAYDVQSSLSERPWGRHWGDFFYRLSDDVVEPLTFVAGFDICLGILLHSRPIVSRLNQFVY